MSTGKSLPLPVFLIKNSKDVIFFLMEYKPTKAQSEILLTLKKKDKKSSKKSNFNTSALEGCLTKGFVREEGEEILLTELGAKQI